MKRIKFANTFLLLGEYYISAFRYLHFLQKLRQGKKPEQNTEITVLNVNVTWEFINTTLPVQRIYF